jgi:hypothetical protein
MEKVDKKEVEKDIKKYSSIDVITKTKGGQIVIASLQETIGTGIDKLCMDYKTKPLAELIPVIAEIDKSLELLRVLTRAGSNKDLAMETLKELENKEIEQAKG